jgi:hypothetical protein
VQGPGEAAKSTIANREPQINPGRPYFVMELVRGIKITEPVVACPPSNLYKFQKLVRRNKLAFAAGAGIAAALVIGLAIALWQSIEKTRAYQEQARLRQEAQEEAAKSKEVVKFLKDILASAGPEVPTAEGCCRRMRSVVQLPWERRHPAGESPWFAHAGEDAGAPRFVVPKRSSGIAEAFPKPSRCS